MGDGCTVSAFSEDGKATTCCLFVSSDGEAGTVDLPRTYYPGYRAIDRLNGQMTVSESPQGLVRIGIPAGYTGDVSVFYRESTLWRMGWWVSVLSLSALCVLYALDRRRVR